MAHKIIYRKLFSLLACFNLLFNSLAPIYVYAEEISPTPTPVETPAPTPESTPSPENTPTPTETPTPESTPTQAPTSSPTPENTPTPTPTPEPTATATPTPSQEITPTTEPSVTSSEESTPSTTPTSSPTPTESITPTPENIPALTVTPSPESTPTQEPTATPTPSPQVTTDKQDYAPTDTVKVSGTNFFANSLYLSTISSVTGGYSNTTDVNTDETGAFSYFHSLDGIYRPNYSINVTDTNNISVATATFTDSFKVDICHSTSSETNPYTSNSVNINSVADCLNAGGHGSDPNDIIPPYTFETCTYPGKNYDSSYNMSLLANGCSAPADLKITKTNDLGTENAVAYQNFTWKLRIENIGQGDAVFNDGENIVTDNLPSSGTYGNPTYIYNNVENGNKISCSISSNTLNCNVSSNSVTIKTGGSIDINFTATFSTANTYTNPQSGGICRVDPNSTVPDPDRSNNDCSNTVTVTSNTGTITIVKNAVPNNSQDFLFRNNFGNNNPATFYLDDDGNNTDTYSNTRTFTVTPGTYSVSEDSTPGWKLAEASCSDESPITRINVSANENVTCTFTNKKLGSIVLVKNTIGGDDTFSFSLSGNPLPSSTSITTVNNTGSKTFTDIDPDIHYSITEDSLTGWNQTSVVCRRETGVEQDNTNIVINNGGTVTCTFANTKKGSITVHNFEDENANGVMDSGDNPPGVTDWPNDLYLGSDCTGTHLSRGLTNITSGNAVYSNLEPGNYSVREDIINIAWMMTTPVCQNVTVTAGQNSTLYFGKFVYGTILGTKFNDLNSNGLKDAGDEGIPNWTIALDRDANGIVDETAVTDDNGNYSFSNLTAGIYRIREVSQDSWRQTSVNPDDITIHSGSYVQNVNFGNVRRSVPLFINKFEDLNNNGTRDEGENGLYGWSFHVFTNNTCTGTPVLSGTTDSNGQAVLRYLNQDQTYWVNETAQTNWDITTGNCRRFTTHSEENSNNVIYFGNFHRGQVSGYKFNDENNNGQYEDGEQHINGWEIRLYRRQTQNTGWNYLNNFVTGSGGATGLYEFPGLTQGDYKVCEVQQSGWTQTYPIDTFGRDSLDEANNCNFFSITSSGQSIRKDFGNVQLKNIYGYKWNDINGNREHDCQWSEDSREERTCEEKLPNWRIFIDANGNKILDNNEINTVTDSSGSYRFENLTLGKYSVCEVEETGWIRTYPQQTNCHSVNLNVESGDQEADFGNRQDDPEITITKFNNASQDKTPGSSVQYHILLEVNKSGVNGLTVKDLLPKGFVYRSGSYQAWVNGSLVNIFEPQYHSPGTWNLGNFKAGDKIELIYTADISSSVDPGKYLDVVWAQGESASEQPVMALAKEGSFVDINFAGTTVNVIKDQTDGSSYDVEKKEEVVGQVLGASTSLPSTGANELWLIASLVSLYFGFKLSRNNKANEK